MRYTVNYLVSPRQALIDDIERLDARGLVDIVEPLLWSALESDKTNFKPADRDALVKLLFVDMIMRERSDAPAYAQVFDGLSATLTGFDRYWTLVRVEFDTSVEDALEESFKYGDIDSMVPTGSKDLDEFLIESRTLWLEKKG